MALNEDLQFADADADVKWAFTRTPARMLLPAPTTICRFASSRSLVGTKGIAAWWLFLNTTPLPGGSVADGMSLHEERARRLGKSLRDYLRVRTALSDEFDNSMTYEHHASIEQPVWSFVGVAAGQPEFRFRKEERAKERVFLIGGVVQIWVPNLTFQYVRPLVVRG